MSLGFSRLWIGSTASGLATWALPFVLGLSVLDGELTGAELGFALAARTVGFLAAVPAAGVFSDQLGPRFVILVSSFTAAAGVPLITWGLNPASTTDLLILLLGSLIAGIGQGACRPAYQAIVPKLVRADRLQRANAAMSIAIRGTNLVGPVLAVAAAAAFGNRAALLGIATLWTISGLMPPFIQDAGQRTAQPPVVVQKFIHRFVSDLKQGAFEAFRHPWFLAGLAALTTVIATSYSVMTVILPEVSREAFGGPVLLTTCVTANALGAFAGALIMAYWHPASRGWVALFGLACCGLMPFSLLAPTNPFLPAIAFFIAGIGIEVFNVQWFTAVQSEVPTDKLSRVSSLDFMFSYGLAPVGLALLAPASQLLGRDVVLLACGSLSLIVPVWAMSVATAQTFSKIKSSSA